MKNSKYEGISESILKAIGNDSANSAANQLSSVFEKHIEITSMDAYVANYDSIFKVIGRPEEIFVVVTLELTGEIEGVMLFLASADFMNKMFSGTIVEYSGEYGYLDPLGMEILNEVGNVVISNYIDALSKRLQIKISCGSSSADMNMLGGIEGSIKATANYNEDVSLIIKDKFNINGSEAEGYLLMLQNDDSIELMMKKMRGI